jgi:hypothetical protein
MSAIVRIFLRHAGPWSLAILFIFSLGPAMAAKRLGPPIEELRSAPERVRIVRAEAREKQAPNVIVFSVVDRLTGDSPDEILLRTDLPAFADVQAGQKYIVAWTDLRRNRGVIGGWEQDPEGFSTVEVIGLGEATIFEDSPELVFLFGVGTPADQAAAGKQLDALLALLQREDPRSQGLAATELMLRPDLLENMSSAQAGRLQQALDTREMAPLHRDYLLRAVLEIAPELTSPWLAEQFRRVIISYGNQYDLASFVPGLVRTAARGLQQTGEPTDVALLDLLLYSNNPGVAKAALSSMDSLDRQAAVGRAQLALERGWIHAESRMAIQRYLTP